MEKTRLDSDFLGLLNEYRGAIHRVCRTYAASAEDRDDLIQEVVYQLWRAFPSYRREAAPITWVYRIALNAAITALRRRSRRPAHVSLEAASDVPSPPSPETGDVRLELLYRAIRSLGEVERALLMCYLLIFAIAAAALTGFVWWRQGLGIPLAGAVAGSIITVLWSRRSGHSYVERMFRRYRAELADCLRQLESEA